MKATLIDNETGEILNENFYIDTLKDKQNRTQKAKESKLTKEFRDYQQQLCGYFFFFILKHIVELEKVLNDVNLVRFIYLGSYIKKDFRLGYFNNNTYFNKNKLKEILKMSDESFRLFFKTITKNNLLIELDDGTFKINEFIFYRGKERDYKKITGFKLDNFTRLYIKAVRTLYEQNYKYPTKLAIAYKLLPYTNWKWNVLCTNVEEINRKNLKLITIGDIMDIFNYNKKSIKRFSRDFYNIKFNDSVVFLSVQKQPEYLDSFICVNPLVSYRGTDIESLQYLKTLFGIENK